jgi:hypothetical protein
MKIKTLALISMLFIAVLVVSGCTTKTNTPVTEAFVFTKTEDVYAFSAVSTTSLLQENLVSNISTLNYGSAVRPNVHLMSETTDTPAVEGEMDELNKYLNMMEKFLGNNNGLTVENAVSDRPEYQTKLVYTTKDLLGNDVLYTIYYNEVADTETTEEDNEHTSTVLTGLMIINGTEYALEGRKEFEDGEQKVTMISKVDNDNYVKVTNKTEDNEQKFQYEVKVNGIITNRTEVKVETEDDEIKTVLKFVEGDAKGEYSFKQETEDGVQIIKIKYEIKNALGNESGEIKIYVTVDATTGETSYEYRVKDDREDKEHTYEHERHEDDDDDEEDEDTDSENETDRESDDEADENPENEVPAEGTSL